MRPIADKYDVEIGAKFFKLDGKIWVAGSYSDGDRTSVYVLSRAPNIKGGTLVAIIHTHPSGERFSGTTAWAKWGDIEAHTTGSNGSGDLVTSYNNRINAYVSIPGGVVLGWNYNTFVNQSATNGWANLGDTVYEVK